MKKYVVLVDTNKGFIFPHLYDIEKGCKQGFDNFLSRNNYTATTKPVLVEFEMIPSKEDQRKNISRLEDEITGLQLKLERLLREVNT